MTLFLLFQKGWKAIFTIGTVAQQNGPIFAKQAIKILMGNLVFLPPFIFDSREESKGFLSNILLTSSAEESSEAKIT